MMLSCKAATELASISQDRPLTSSERWQLRLHFLMCNGCRQFDKQVQWLRQTAKQLPAHWDDTTPK